MQQWCRTYLVILPKWFALPFIWAPIGLGEIFAEGITWRFILVMLTGAMIMVGGHYYNNWAEYIYNLSRGTPPLADKWYTLTSIAISAGLTTLKKVAIGWIICYAISAIIIAYICLAINSAWPLVGWAIAITAAPIYSPGFSKGLKHVGFPEYWGIVGFGIGGCLLGYSAQSGSISFIPVFGGIAISLFWSLSWAVHQFPEAESDYKKGVKNLGTIVAVTRFPLALYWLPVMLFAYMFQIFVISLGLLTPWTFLSVLALPFFMLAAIWVNKSQDNPQSPDFEKGIITGLVAIFIVVTLFIITQAFRAWLPIPLWWRAI